MNEKIIDGPTSNTPKLNIGSYKEVYSSSQNITVSATNATSIEYSINNGSKQTLSGSTIALPSSLANGLVSLTITAKNSYGSDNKTIKLIKTDALVDKDLVIYDIDTNYTNFLWVWKDNGEGSWKEPSLEGTVMGFSMGNNNNFIIAKFQKGTTISNASWDNVQYKSEDTTFDKTIYGYNDFTFTKN